MTIRAVLVALPVGVALATPAFSEGILEALFGLRPDPPPQYYAPTHAPRMVYAPRRRDERRSEPQPRPKLRYARLPRQEVKEPMNAESAIPLKPKPMGQVENPLPALLTDSTLRDGDIVVFPDGLRVFKGSEGEKHKLSAFAPVTQKNVGSSTRKLLASMKVGPNEA